jgi:hypothetical protein
VVNQNEQGRWKERFYGTGEIGGKICEANTFSNESKSPQDDQRIAQPNSNFAQEKSSA